MRYCVIFLLAIAISNSYAQDSSEVKTMIIGKWTMSKFTLDHNGIAENMWTTEFKNTYTFNSNGTWTSTYWRKGYGTNVSAGKWTVIEGGTKIHLYNNKFLPPHDKDGTLANHNLNVLKLSDREFITNECMFGEVPGTSYYRKTQ